MTQENFNSQNVWKGNNNEEENNLQLADLWSMIWDNRIWYILSVLACLFIAVFYIYRTPKTYSRSAKVIVDEAAGNSTMRELAAFSNTMTRYRGQGGTNVYNEIEAFKSPDLMARVVKRLGYEVSYVEYQFLRQRELFATKPFVMQPVGGNPVTSFGFDVIKDGDSSFVIKNFSVGSVKIKSNKIEGRLNDTILTPVGSVVLIPTHNLNNWDKDIRVSWVNSMSRAKLYMDKFSSILSGKESSVVILSLTDRFPVRAENIVRTVLDMYNEEWVENKSKSAVNTSKFINERLNIIEKELGNVEGSLKDYKEKNKITDIQAVSDSYLQQSYEYGTKAFDINNQLSIGKFIRDYINDQAHQNELIPANSGLTSISVNQQIKDYNDCLLKRNRLIAESSAENPAVAELTEVAIQLRMAVNRSIESLIATLQLQANKISDQENEIMKRIASTSGQQLQLLSIERQQKVKEQLYIYLLQKREENEITALVNVENTRMIMEPNGSPYPAAPNKGMILLVAFILGLIIPFAVFFLISQLDTRVKSRADIIKLQAPFLAEIPQMGLTGNWFKRFRTNRFNDHNCQIIVEAGKRDMMNEAFRVLRTNLDLMTNGNNGKCNKIMVTSFNPNAGKTFMIMNMASSMALKGSKTLLLLSVIFISLINSI